MTRETDYIIQTMFERESLEEMTLDELQAKLEQYPYSSIIRYLHSLKLKETYDRHYPESVSATALYFSNPHWLYYQLSDDSERGVIKKFMPEEVEEVEIVEEVEEVEMVEEVEGVEMVEKVEEVENTSILQSAMEALKVTADQPVTDDQLVFEPYHTVDYFASQGIKLGVMDEKDALGQRVKSFTAWLKTMKRIEPDTNTSKSGNGQEQEAAIPASEMVVTETMAEVYIKQGAYKKALDVYEKLSLQNPANSHIFAVRIKEIKEKLI